MSASRSLPTLIRDCQPQTPSTESALGGLSFPKRDAKRSYQSTRSAPGRLSTSIQDPTTLPEGALSVPDGNHTSTLGRDKAFGLPEVIHALPASQHMLLQRSLLAALSRPRRKRKRRKRHDPEDGTKAAKDLLISCFSPTSRPLPITSPAFSSVQVAYCNAEPPGSKLHDERCADVREAYRTLRFLDTIDP